MTKSSHTHLGIRLPDTGSSSRTSPVSLTCQSTTGNHQLATPLPTQAMAQRLTQPSSSSVAPPQPNRTENTGQGPQLGQVTHDNYRAHANCQAHQDETTCLRAETEALRATQQLGTAAEPVTTFHMYYTFLSLFSSFS